MRMKNDRMWIKHDRTTHPSKLQPKTVIRAPTVARAMPKWTEENVKTICKTSPNQKHIHRSSLVVQDMHCQGVQENTSAYRTWFCAIHHQLNRTSILSSALSLHFNVHYGITLCQSQSLWVTVNHILYTNTLCSIFKSITQVKLAFPVTLSRQRETKFGD